MSSILSFMRHKLITLANPNINTGEITFVDKWQRTFAILPKRTISGRMVWLKTIYRRRVWIYTGFIDEPDGFQYGDLFDMLKDEHESGID